MLNFPFRSSMTVNRRPLVFLLVLVFFVLVTSLGVAAQTEPFSGPSSRSDGFPRILWSFWDDSPVPEEVGRCVESWRRHNPGWEVRFLRPKDVARYVPDFRPPHSQNFPARFSDFLRSELLVRYGGFWLDASIFMTESLEWAQRTQRWSGCEMFGFRTVGHERGTGLDIPVLENWFLAAMPGSRLMRDWHTEWMRSAEFPTMDAYVDHLVAAGTDLQKLGDLRYYLAMHAALQRVLQRDGAGPYHLQTAVAELSAFKYLAQGPGDWHSREGLATLCTDLRLHTPVIKFTGGQRRLMEAEPALRTCVLRALETKTAVPI